MTDEIVIRVNKDFFTKLLKVVSLPFLVIFTLVYIVVCGSIGFGIATVLVWVGRRGSELQTLIGDMGDALDAWMNWIRGATK